jgi:hypothetical protein
MTPIGEDRERLIVPARGELDALPTPLTPGELQVLNFFDEHLPSGWEIYYAPHLNGVRPDFVLLNPRVGIAVYEVKDWVLSDETCELVGGRLARSDSRGHRWIEHNPADKAAGYREEIRELYCPSLPHDGVAAVTAGAILPYTSQEDAERFLGGPGAAKTNHVLIVGRQTLAEGLIDRVVPDAAWSSSKFMTANAARDLRHWLIEPEFAREQRTTPHLTARQREVVENSAGVRRRRVRGAAGSGKSFALAGRAAWLTRPDHPAPARDVLVITYNITLVGYLRDLSRPFSVMYGSDRAQITYLHWHAWAKRVMRQLGREDDWAQAFKAPDTVSRDQRLGDIVGEAISDAEEGRDIDHYDAILVDEGQDLEPTWWNALRQALKDPENGEMLLVADTAQDVYDRGPRWTDEQMLNLGFRGGAWMQLNDSFRMPHQLIDLARALAREYLHVPSDELVAPPPQQELAVEPVNLRWLQVDADDLGSEGADTVLTLVEQSDRGNGSPIAWADVILVADEVTVGSAVIQRLPPSIRTITTFAEDDRVRRRQKLVFFKGDARVKATTVHSIKGWEATSVVVALGANAGSHGARLLYTAITRLKRRSAGSHLTVVCSDSTFAEFGKQWPVFEDRRA